MAGYGKMKSSGTYRGTAGGMKGMKVGGGTTFKSSGGAGQRTGGKFKQPYPKTGGRKRHASMKRGV